MGAIISVVLFPVIVAQCPIKRGEDANIVHCIAPSFLMRKEMRLC